MTTILLAKKQGCYVLHPPLVTSPYLSHFPPFLKCEANSENVMEMAVHSMMVISPLCFCKNPPFLELIFKTFKEWSK